MKKFVIGLILSCIVGLSFASSIHEKLAALPLEKLQKIEAVLTTLKNDSRLDDKKKRLIQILSPLVQEDLKKRAAIAALVVKNKDNVTIEYTAQLDDGTTVFGTYDTPFTFTVGDGVAASYLDTGVIGMRIGDKKIITVSPADAYGEQYIEEQTLSDFNGSFIQSYGIGEIMGIFDKNAPKDELRWFFKKVRVGEKIILRNASMEIISLEGDNMSVRVVNSDAPFFGKKLTVGLSAVDKAGNTYTIKSLDESDGTVTVLIKMQYEVVAQDESGLTIKTKNTNYLAGEKLIISMELLSLTPYVEPVLEVSQADIKSIKEGAYIKGNKDAEILWIEYSDMECPFCKRLHDSGAITNLEKKYGDKLAVSFKHYPLPFHSTALPAAESAECVGEAGGSEKFFAFIEGIFNKGVPSQDIIDSVVKEIGLDAAKIKTCADSGKFADKIDAQKSEGTNKFSIYGTPGSLFINTKTGKYEIVSGAQPEIKFQEAIERLLTK